MTISKKWCVVHNLRNDENRRLRRNFNAKVKEPYIGELAGNPMQLTILIYLIWQRGDATPNQRTRLYDAYMDMLLQRESNKHPDSVRKHSDDLREIVPFLGWYIQSRAETSSTSGRMTQAELEAAMRHFQGTYGKQENVINELFTAATDRLWALTSKEEGTFEFEVLSLREYFAARFLYYYAGEGDRSFDRNDVFRELLKRPHWLNTARFYAGNASVSDIYVLKAGIEAELQENPTDHVRIAIWNLITDGVFNDRPKETASIVNMLVDKNSARSLLVALEKNDISHLPDPRHAEIAWNRLTADISANPEDPTNYDRVRVLQELLGMRSKFAQWWHYKLTQAIGTELEVAWLEIGAQCEVAAQTNLDIPPGLSAADGYHAQLILNTGIVPPEGGQLEKELMEAVLAGQCTETTSVRSLPAQIAVVLSPAEFYETDPKGSNYRPTRNLDEQKITGSTKAQSGSLPIC